MVNVNCWAHARRDFADAIKALDKSNADAIKQSIAHQTLEKIGKIYEEDVKLKGSSSEIRLQMRQTIFRPIVEYYFVWVK